MTSRSTDRPTALVVGASRGLGHAIAAELAERGWAVVATVRDPTTRTPLHDLADASAGRVTVEHLDIDQPDQLPPLHERLAGRTIDLLLISAGVTNDPTTPIGEVSTEEFTRVMTTNALSPMRVIEALQDRVASAGLIGAMSSGQGSIANNTAGGRELYRASKASLNMLLRGFAARPAQSARTFVLMAPGWVRTALGGDSAPFTIEETVPMVVDVLESQRGRTGIAYLDRFGGTVPW